jgi:DNA-binding response OmpR family regulator
MAAKSKILIVDDERFNLDLLEQLLDELGYRTVSAMDGQAALDVAVAEKPDLILLDVMMPVLDGFAACRILKEREETRLIPVVIMTALDGFEDRIKGIEAGADDFLTKPVNERELAARLRTTLKFKQAVDQEIDQLRRIKDHLAKFVPETVKRLVTANPQAPELAKQERRVSVLFLDISGYTRLCEALPAPVVNDLLERYFSSFLDHIHDADGDISDTAGDGMMAIFQDSGTGDHAERAVGTALDLFDATRQLNEASEVQALGLHMGVNSGKALVGSTKIEGRRGTRWVFTASGPMINLAARLAGIAQAGQLVVGPDTARHLGDRYRLEPIGVRRLKNIAEPVDLHLVLGRMEVD